MGSVIIFFAPHVRPSPLMLNGRYDEDFPVVGRRTALLYKLFREPKSFE